MNIFVESDISRYKHFVRFEIPETVCLRVILIAEEYAFARLGLEFVPVVINQCVCLATKFAKVADVWLSS